jgi:serine phosphatase RsbU (regulator of sigma subunit)
VPTVPPFDDAPRHRRLTAEVKYRLLLQISRTMSGTLDLDEILNHLLDTVREALRYDAAGVFVLNRQDLYPRPPGLPHQLIAGMAARGFDPRPAGRDPMLVGGKGIIGHVIRTGEKVVAPDVTRNPYYVEGRAATHSEIAVPIVLQGTPIGALNLESDTLGEYDERDVDVLDFFAEAAAISIEKAMLHRQLLEKKRIEDQLHIAQEVQSRLLPSDPPALAGYDIAGLSLPTYDIGGDYFDYFPVAGGGLGLVIADVSGKGIPAALIMATFRALLRTHARRDADAARVVQAVNAQLVESVGLPAFVTAVYGVLDAATGRFAYANCGHNPPLVVRATGRVDLLGSSGPFLGVFAQAEHESGEAVLEPGDRLVLFTDGVVDTFHADGTEFGVDRLADTIRRSNGAGVQDILQRVVEATRGFSGSTTFQDDFTLMIVQREAR